MCKRTSKALRNIPPQIRLQTIRDGKKFKTNKKIDLSLTFSDVWANTFDVIESNKVQTLTKDIFHHKKLGPYIGSCFDDDTLIAFARVCITSSHFAFIFCTPVQ